MADETKNPDADARLVLGLIDGFRASKAAFTAVSLGIFDSLHRRESDAAELAREMGCERQSLERLLGACASLGLLAVGPEGRYRNQPVASRFLRRESEETLSGYLLYSDRVLYRLWGRLEDAVREGSNRWEQEFGRRESLFDHFFATEQDKRTFLAGMHGLGQLSSPAAAAAFDLSRFARFVDLGGGTGHLAIAACRLNAGLRGAVYDLPAVATVAAEYVERAGLSGRIEIIAGDFFRDELPPADLYGVGRILHDWGEREVSELLRKIHRSLPENGALLICEKLLDEQHDGPAAGCLQSLNMLICTEGRERSAEDYEALVRTAGFRRLRWHRTGQPLDVMLAEK